MTVNAASSEAVLTQATQAFASGNYARAADLLAPAALAEPGNADLATALAYSWSRLGQLDRAMHAFEQALTLRPTDPALLRDAAVVDLKAGRSEAALARLQQAQRLAPGDISVLGKLIDTMLVLGQPEAALALLDSLLARASRSPVLHYLRGTVLGALERHHEERRAYEYTLQLNPRLPDVHTNLGVLARDEHRFQDALRHFKHALAIDPEHAGARNNRAQTNLLLGQYQHGWRDYEWRWHDDGQTMPCPGPHWLGETPLAGKTLLVHAEQGLGDTIQFSRYVPSLANRAKQVVLRVQAPLKTLLQANLDGVEVISDTDPLPSFDLHIPLLSLPLALSKQQSSPWPLIRPFIADTTKKQQWAARLEQAFGPSGQRPRIGIAWSGNPQHPGDRQRSIAFADFATLLEVPCDFVCIQKDLRPADRAAIEAWRSTPSAGRLYVASDALQDFNDSAALLACLDHVISVDTSTVHLAGALGLPTWLLLPAMPDWRWQLTGTGTPWYPSLSLLRQSSTTGWAPVLQALKERLKQSI